MILQKKFKKSHEKKAENSKTIQFYSKLVEVSVKLTWLASLRRGSGAYDQDPLADQIRRTLWFDIRRIFQSSSSASPFYFPF